MVALLKINGLMWADGLAGYAMWMTMEYLTDAWKLRFTHAAALVNFFWGMVLILLIGMHLLVDTFIGDYWMVLLSSFSFSIGLGFLSMSTPPVTGTCSSGYDGECIGQGLIFTALALIAVGLSGHITSLGSFICEQSIAAHSGADNSMLCTFVGVLVHLAGFAIYFIKPWSIKFGIPAICTVVATLVFLTGSCSYKTTYEAIGSPFTIFFKVFVASASKVFAVCPGDASKLYEQRDADYRLPHTRRLRFLDKAAIILPTQPLQQQKNNSWRLCRVTHVEETKSFLCIIPICMTFIITGVVSAIGTSYFLGQAVHMNRNVGRVVVPLPIFQWFYCVAKQLFSNLQTRIAGQRKHGPAIGIAVSMIFAILSCITAAKVETWRLGAVKSHGLVEKPEETVPMSMLWLLPQFLLLGGFDGIADNGIACFLSPQIPRYMVRYRCLFATATSGVGMVGNVLSVYLVGEISGRGGKVSWFQQTINKSRLDNYYWTLAALAAANLVVYVLLSFWYAFTDSKEDDVPEDDEAVELFPILSDSLSLRF